ncbi:MAG: hypothetical protein NC405_09045 [Odoribacter sp.]|nr:hypothetical protein [Odoribacter sp.]
MNISLPVLTALLSETPCRYVEISNLWGDIERRMIYVRTNGVEADDFDCELVRRINGLMRVNALRTPGDVTAMEERVRKMNCHLPFMVINTSTDDTCEVMVNKILLHGMIREPHIRVEFDGEIPADVYVIEELLCDQPTETNNNQQ